MKLLVRRFEYVWHVCAFALLMGAFVPLWRQQMLGGIDPGDGDPVQRLILGIAYLGVILLVFHLRDIWHIAQRVKLLWLLLAWVLLSTLWSAAPEITLRRGLGACLGSLYGLLLIVRYPPRKVFRILGTTLTIVIVTSFIVALALPNWGVMGWPQEGAWRGVMAHKNILGRTSVLAVIVFFALWKSSREQKRLIWAIMWILAIVLLFASRSGTSVLALFAAYVAWWFAIFWRRLPKPLQFSSISLGAAIALTIAVVPISYLAFLENVVALFGKNITLTGRIPLWLTLIPYAKDRLLLGYGYGAFWLGDKGVFAGTLAFLSWKPTHGHNGYLDLWLEVGLIGGVLGLAMLFQVLFRAGRIVRNTRIYNLCLIYIIGYMFIVSFILLNSTYTLLLDFRLGTGMYWVLLVYFYAYFNSKIEFVDRDPFSKANAKVTL